MTIKENKMKKKRKIDDTCVEAPVKKKRSKNQQSSDVDNKKITKVEPHEDVRQEYECKEKEKKKKKRKHEEIAENNAILKKEKNNYEAANEKIKNKLETNFHDEQSQIQENCNKEQEGGVSNKENKLTGKLLRKSFNSKEGLETLRKFLTMCKELKEKDLVEEYLQAGGSVLEVLRLLDTSDKKNVNNAATVFSAMHLIIMKILSKFPQYQSNAEEACRHFINSHLSFVHSMLSSQSNAKHRKIVLRLLTSMVSLGGSLPRELLGHLSFHSQVLETLSQHTKPTDSQSVRTCYIHFVLAFLIEGNVAIIRALLDKRGMLSSIFSGLIYDSHETVHLALETVKTWVLKNSAISKTSKLHVFSTPVLQSLVSLYNWKGPKNWPGPKGKKGDSQDVINQEEKEVAVEALHDFLITLLTSNRYGVIFHDRSLGTSGWKHNQLVNTVLQSLDRPWEHSKPLDLVVKILVACPDLVRSQLAYTEPFLEPRASKKWIMVMRFLGKLFESFDLENSVKSCLSEISSSQLISAAQNLTIPLSVLKNAIGPSLINKNIMIRQEGVVLLSIMLKKVKSFARIVEINTDEADYLFFRNSMIDYISKNVPSLESILNVWKCALEPEEKMEVDQEEILDEIPRIDEHFEAILDLLESYREVCPERMDLSEGGEEKSGILLSGLDMICGIPEVEMLNFYKMKVKALKFLLFVETAAFAPRKSLFGKTLVFLLSILNNEEIESQCHETAKMLLSTCGMFEGCDEQIDFWLKSFSCLENEEEKLEAINWFVKIVQRAIKKSDKFLDMLVEAEESTGEQVLSTERMEKIFNDLCKVGSENNERNTETAAAVISIPPIVCSAIESLKKNCNESLTKYLSNVTVLTLHCQVSPGTLIHLTENLSLPSRKYLKSWMPEEKPTSLKKSLTNLQILSKLSNILMSDDLIDFETLTQGSKKVEFLSGDKKYSLSHDLSEFEIFVLMRMTTFYLTQMVQRGDLSQNQFDKYKLCFIGLLHVARSSNEDLFEKCSRIFFTHPTILSYFSPIYKTENLVQKIVTAGILDISRAVIDLSRDCVILQLFLPFKKKLIAQLISAAKKCNEDKKVKKSLFVAEFLEILRPTPEDVIKILTLVMELPRSYFLSFRNDLSICGNLVVKLLDILTQTKTSDLTIDIGMVKKISYCCFDSKTYKSPIYRLWGDALQRYLECYPRNIAGIDARTFNALLKFSSIAQKNHLLLFLISRNDQFVPLFVKYISSSPQAFEQRDLIFSVIERRLDYSWNKEFLKKIYENSRDEILSYFAGETEKKSWICENVKATSFIIDKYFELEDCRKGSEIILSNGDKLDNVDVNFVQLLESLFRRQSELENSEDSLTKLVQVLIRVMVSVLKKDSKNEEKLETVSKIIRDTIVVLKSKRKDFLCEEFSKNYSWPQFTRFSLKLGLKSPKNEDKETSVLKTLLAVCDVAYKDASENEYVKNLFEMTTSHSEFVNIMLSSHKIKRDLLELILVLVRKNHSTMLSSQIPLYLASYNATLEESDQFILLILQHYESKGIKLNEYKPYLWGEAAASYYSVKGEADTALWRQPSTSQVLDLFNTDIVQQTIKNFPVNRDLQPSQLHKSTKVYDPSFYLPLLTYLLADNMVVACHKVTQSGALALALAASSSVCEKTRLAAYTVISRFYFHLEATKSKEKHLWIRLLDAFRNGILETESPVEELRISCLVSTFLARASLVTTQPTNRLYSPIQTFLMAKPALELNTIPEFLQLFHSSDIEHETHRHWILEVIRDGLKTYFDMNIALKCVLFKMLLDFYNCILADDVTKRLILEIIESSVKIPKSGSLLVRSYGLLPWLCEIATCLTPRDLDQVQIVVSILRETLNIAIRANDQNLRFLIFNALEILRHCFSKNTSPACFQIYVNALCQIIKNSSHQTNLKQEDLADIVGIGKQIYGDINEVENMLRHGGKFVSKIEDVEMNCDEFTIGKVSLARLVSTWYRSSVR